MDQRWHRSASRDPSALAIPLLTIISVATWTTKLPMLPTQGFWAMAHEARTDWCMLLGALFLILVGPGPWSVDRTRSDRR
jgi:putative oxidoreductase